MNFRRLLPALLMITALAALNSAARGQCSQTLSLPDSQPAVGFFGGSNFGLSVAVSGNWAVVGEPYYSSGGGLINNGRIVVYHRTSGTAWNQDHILAGTISSGNLGWSVAIDA